jgi:hypothetical protein
MLNGTELGHLDKHRKGGFSPNAGDAGDVEANFLPARIHNLAARRYPLWRAAFLNRTSLVPVVSADSSDLW